MEDEGIWNSDEVDKKMESYIDDMGWKKKMNITTQIIVDNMEKGIAYKANKTMWKEKYDAIIDREIKKLPNEFATWHDSTFEAIHNEWSYNLAQHEWVLATGNGGDVKKSYEHYYGNNTRLYKE
jgi:hypothetical protein